jgi:hypothetical protein
MCGGKRAAAEMIRERVEIGRVWASIRKGTNEEVGPGE